MLDTKITIALAAAALALPGFAAEPTPVKVTVTDSVLRAKVPRIGFNVCENPIDDKSTLLQNCLNSNPGLEAGVLCRRLFAASAGDARTFEVARDDACQRFIPANFWAGAEFRVLDGKAAGRRGKISRCVYNQGKSVFTVQGPGSAFAAGDLIWLNAPAWKAGLGSSFYPEAWKLIAVAEGEHAPFHGGSTCLKLDKTCQPANDSNKVFWLPSFSHLGGGRGGDREGNADRFLQEKAYRISLWAKGTPGAKGSVRFVASSEYGGQLPTDDFVLTGNWKKYELVRKSDPMVNACVVMSGGDEMCLDNFVISEDDGGEPLAILPRVAGALADLKPGTLRLLGGARGESLDNWLAHPLERLRSIEYAPWSVNFRDPDQPNLPDSLNLCERAGASPWLVMGLAMTGEEWDNLLEYLAGPVHTPYGAKRAKNGQPDAWLKTFDKVYIELGDEVWNTRKAPWSLSDPVRYAAWAERVFSRVKKSKYYSEKIRLVAGGRADDTKWNDAVLKGCPSLDVLSCSTATNVPANVDGAAMAAQQLLAYPVTRTLPQLAAVAQAAQAAGKSSALGGCAVVSAEGSFLGPERSLLRSQSAAVAILDELLLAVAGGSEALEFSRFAQGSDNATHVDAHTMTLHPAAQAIRLFNLHAGGRDLVKSSLTPPLPDGPAPGVPALAIHAFKGQGGYSVLLLNRSLAAAYRATVTLPAKSGKLRCYRIANNDPLATNLNEVQVKTEESDGNFATGIEVPAHSIVLLETAEAGN